MSTVFAAFASVGMLAAGYCCLFTGAELTRVEWGFMLLFWSSNLGSAVVRKLDKKGQN